MTGDTFQGRKLDVLATGRTCGECSACCTVLSVPRLKGPNETCRHARRMQPVCGIYPSRPEQCRDYACLWLSGVAPKRMRPDRCGVILDLAADELDSARLTAAAGGVKWCIAREVRPGAFASEVGAALLEAVASQGLVALAPFFPGGPKVMGPPAMVEAWERQAAL
jgi:hypothetical protein